MRPTIHWAYGAFAIRSCSAELEAFVREAVDAELNYQVDDGLDAELAGGL